MTHPSAYEYRKGCKCEGCTSAHRLRCAASIASLRERLAADPGAASHGTESAYVNGGCRCARCRAAGRLRNARARALLKAAAGKTLTSLERQALEAAT
jgi:hypothetical protein